MLKFIKETKLFEIAEIGIKLLLMFGPLIALIKFLNWILK
jgi:hypothetical protein